MDVFQLKSFHLLPTLQEMETRRSHAISRPATAASDRPTTAPALATGPAGPARPPAPSALAVERSASVLGGPLSVDCQPNQMAPLLRDEKSRRDWVERELDACCASYDLQVGDIANRIYHITALPWSLATNSGLVFWMARIGFPYVLWVCGSPTSCQVFGHEDNLVLL